MGWAIWRAGQAVQVGFGEMLLRNMAKTAASAVTSANRTGRVCVSCKPKVHHNRSCDDTFPGQCCDGGPWDARGDAGAEESAMGPVRINEGSHVESGGDINFVVVCGRVGVMNSKAR
jgi:hypothetical protein